MVESMYKKKFDLYEVNILRRVFVDICVAQIKPFIRFARYLTMEKGSDYPVRIAYDARLFYATTGVGYIDSGGHRYQLSAGDVILIPPGTEYHLQALEEQVVYLAVNFDYTSACCDIRTPIPPVGIGFFDKERLIESLIFTDAPVLNSVLYIKNIVSLEKPLIKIVAEYTKKLTCHELQTSALFCQIIVACLRAANGASAPQSGAASRKILDYIHEHYREKLTCEKIGDVFGFHPNYAAQLVRLQTGFSLHGYLTQVRIENACEKLSYSTWTISEIAEDCGFCDVAHFSKSFRRLTGLTPSEYRKQY